MLWYFWIIIVFIFLIILILAFYECRWNPRLVPGGELICPGWDTEHLKLLLPTQQGNKGLIVNCWPTPCHAILGDICLAGIAIVLLFVLAVHCCGSPTKQESSIIKSRTQGQHPTGRLPDELCSSTLKAENTTYPWCPCRNILRVWDSCFPLPACKLDGSVHSCLSNPRYVCYTQQPIH